jgi:hypothetical protein
MPSDVLSCHFDAEMPNVSHILDHTISPLAKLKPVYSSVVKSALEELEYKHLLPADTIQICLSASH